MANFDINLAFVGAELAEIDQKIAKKFTRGDLIFIKSDHFWPRITKSWPEVTYKTWKSK